MSFTPSNSKYNKRENDISNCRCIMSRVGGRKGGHPTNINQPRRIITILLLLTI